MPHFFKTINFYILFLIIAISVGCKSRNPNPQFSDPIFLDYQAQYKEHSKLAESFPKQIESAAKELKATAPRSTERVVAQRALEKLKNQYKQAQQKSVFYKIRMEKRQIYSKLAYEKAFLAGKPWPDPNEFKSYTKNKALRSVNLNWNARVPKLFKGSPNYQNK